MKANIARCVHGRIWFQPCDECDTAEALWLFELRSGQWGDRRITDLFRLEGCKTPVLCCTILDA